MVFFVATLDSGNDDDDANDDDDSTENRYFQSICIKQCRPVFV